MTKRIFLCTSPHLRVLFELFRQDPLLVLVDYAVFSSYFPSAGHRQNYLSSAMFVFLLNRQETKFNLFEGWSLRGSWLGEEINNAAFPREKTCDFSTLQFLRLNKISWLVMKMTDLRDTDKSRNFAITELNNFNNCFIIGSESFFSYLPHEPQTTLTMLWWNYSLSRREHFFQLLSHPESGLNPWTWLANLILTPAKFSNFDNFSASSLHRKKSKILAFNGVKQSGKWSHFRFFVNVCRLDLKLILNFFFKPCVSFSLASIFCHIYKRPF